MIYLPEARDRIGCVYMCTVAYAPVVQYKIRRVRLKLHRFVKFNGIWVRCNGSKVMPSLQYCRYSLCEFHHSTWSILRRDGIRSNGMVCSANNFPIQYNDKDKHTWKKKKKGAWLCACMCMFVCMLSFGFPNCVSLILDLSHAPPSSNVDRRCGVCFSLISSLQIERIRLKGNMFKKHSARFNRSQAEWLISPYWISCKHLVRLLASINSLHCRLVA